jgi:hypothetical protein
MSATYIGLCPTCGLVVTADGPLHLGARTITLPAAARWPIVRHGDGVHQVMVSGQDGIAYLVSESGDVQALGGVHGYQNVGFTMDDKPAWQDTLKTYRVLGEGTARTIPLETGSVRGWSGDPALRRSWYDVDTVSPLHVHGVRIYTVSYSPDGAWLAGFSDGPDILVYHQPTDTLYTAGMGDGTPWQVQLVMQGGQPVVLRQAPVAALTRAMFRPYTGPTAMPVSVAPWPAPVTLGAWKLYYEHNGGSPWDTPADLPYDHCVCETSEGVTLANSHAYGVIAGADLIALARYPLAILVYASDVAGAAAGIMTARPIAEDRDVPLLVYLDGGVGFGLPYLPPYAVLSWPWYTLPTENRDAFRTRIRRDVRVCRSAGVGVRFIAPTIQAFDRSLSWPPHALADLQGDLIDLARECADLVVSVECFAYGRSGGIKDYPEMLAWHRAFGEATSGFRPWPRPWQFVSRPTPPPSAPPEPPAAPPPEPAPIPTLEPEDLVRIQIGNQWVTLPRSRAEEIQQRQRENAQAPVDAGNLPPEAIKPSDN